MLPFGYEPGLLQRQYAQRVSIFSCEDFAVYTNESTVFSSSAGQFAPTLIQGPLSCPRGGKWGLAMNTDIFIRVWQAVNQDGRYRNHDWNIKVDPDAVFFPERLRQMLGPNRPVEVPGPDLSNAGSEPVFFNNCQFGMHGPLEVVSRAGMQMFLERMDQCEDVRLAGMDINQPPGLAEKDHAFGEDQYLRRCLRNLGVRQIDDFNLLSEKRACGLPYPTDCSGVRTTFHAFKTEEDWFVCHDFATTYGQWPRPAAAPFAAAPAAAPVAAPAAAPAFTFQDKLHALIERLQHLR